MFWSAFSATRRTALVALHGDPDSLRRGVTARQVLACLQENLPTICEPGSIFMQDNASTHRARIVQSWLQDWAAQHGVGLIQWPALSPDLNPIENAWKLLKESICSANPALSDMPKNALALYLLRKAAVEQWEALKDELFEKLALSMPNRLQAVLDSNGWYTKY